MRSSASNGVDRISGLLKIGMLAARDFFNSIGQNQKSSFSRFAVSQKLSCTKPLRGRRPRIGDDFRLGLRRAVGSMSALSPFATNERTFRKSESGPLADVTRVEAAN
jgi:hypothetical protein